MLQKKKKKINFNVKFVKRERKRGRYTKTQGFSTFLNGWNPRTEKKSDDGTERGWTCQPVIVLRCNCLQLSVLSQLFIVNLSWLLRTYHSFWLSCNAISTRDKFCGTVGPHSTATPHILVQLLQFKITVYQTTESQKQKQKIK